MDDFCDDDSLVARLVAHDRNAFEALYLRHCGAVVGLARLILWDDAVADDVAQNVFVDLWRRPSRFDPDRGSLANFLLLQTRGRAVEAIRSETSRQRREGTVARRNAVSAKGPEAGAVLLATRGRVRGSLQRLPEREREAITLAFFGGLTYREVAAVLGQPEGTIKTRIRAGLKRLRPALADLAQTSP